MFGTVKGYDALLVEQPDNLATLALRDLSPDALLLVAASGRLVAVMKAAAGRGPDRILVETLPAEPPRPVLKDRRKGKPLPDTWSLKDRKLFFQSREILDFSKAPAHSSAVLAEITDFPGHTRTIAARLLKPERELKTRLDEVTKSLRVPLAEAVEGPLLNLIGYGNGRFPGGDAALCGLLLTGKAFVKGRRTRGDWQSRLGVEIRRFLHRTSLLAAANLRFALEGRTTHLQERLFEALAKDYETTSEAAFEAILGASDVPGPEFLHGVSAALELIWSDFEAERAPRGLAGRAMKPGGGGAGVG